VDIRLGSPTYGKYASVILDSEKKNQLWVPKGFAHGFVVLSKTAIFAYKCDNYYAPEHDFGIIWNEKKINIDWKIPHQDIQLSDKDKLHKDFESTRIFNYNQFSSEILYQK